jgi:hypothetical protein
MGLAELRPPRSSIVPFQQIEVALIGPVFCALDITVTHWIVFHIFPFFRVRFSAPQLTVPEISLPNRQLISLWPCSRDVIFPKGDPIVKRARRKSIWRAKQMDMIWHNDVAADAPEIRRFPSIDNALQGVFIRKQPSSLMRANCQKNNDGAKTGLHGWKMGWPFSSIAFEWRRHLEGRAPASPRINGRRGAPPSMLIVWHHYSRESPASSMRTRLSIYGNRMVSVRPLPSLLSMESSPPCSRTIRRTINNPRPVPDGFVVK